LTAALRRIEGKRRPGTNTELVEDVLNVKFGGAFTNE
jgi:hypothetical protein